MANNAGGGIDALRLAKVDTDYCIGSMIAQNVAVKRQIAFASW